MEEVANHGKNSTQLIQHWIDTGKVEVDDNNVPNIIGNADDQNETSMKLSKWRQSKLVTPFYRKFTQFFSVKGKLPSQINMILLLSKVDFMKSEIFLSVPYISINYFVLSSQVSFGTLSKHFEHCLFTFEKSWNTFKNYWTGSKFFWKVRYVFQGVRYGFEKSGTKQPKTPKAGTFAYSPPCKSPEHDLKWPIFGHFWPFLGLCSGYPQNRIVPPEKRIVPFIFVLSLFKNFLICFNTFWNRSTCFSFEIIGAQNDLKSFRAVLRLLEQVQSWIYMCVECHPPSINDIFCEIEIHNIKKMLYVWFIDNIICSEGI